MRTSPIPRRTLLAGAVGVAGAAAWRSPVTAAGTTDARVVTRTSAGLVRGERLDRVTVFRGVPYARPPVGPLRFASPRPPAGWHGVRDATTFAPASLQLVVPGSAEDSLYANVWTPDVSGRRPVFVYIHGGGWKLGAGSLPNYDGAALAARGDIVVVTFNYRLGVLGFGHHPELADPLTGSAADWGLQDQIALLRWIRRNAAAFGGDPDNITLGGTSAGGASTWQLALLPELSGVIRRIIPISACHVWAPATSLTAADSRRVYERIARDFGVTVPGLRDVPGEELRDAWEAIFAGDPAARTVASGREYRGPVLDRRLMPGFAHELPTPRMPMLVVSTRTEGSFYTGPGSPMPTQSPTNDAELREAVRAFLLKGAATVEASLVDGCVAAYRDAARADGLPTDPLSIFTEVWGDGLFRYEIVRLSERHAREGISPQYVMDFAHPVRAPWFGTPHEATSPFLFGTYGLPENAPKFGDGPLERTVSETFMDLVASFARHGVPASPTAPSWPVFAPGRPTTMILGGADVARVAATPKQRQLRFWDAAGWVPTP